MQEVLNQLVLPAIIGCAGFVVWYLKALGEDVRDLTERAAVYVEKVSQVVIHIEDHEDRLRQLENDRAGLN